MTPTPTRDGLEGNVSHAAIASRGAGAARTIASAAVAPPRQACKAKTKEGQEDIFVSWSRPEPFQLRHKLVTLLKGSPSDIQHVRRTRDLAPPQKCSIHAWLPL
ncbi:hypothetical protein E4U09_002969, partial [Claviceps aff. purpurea]